MIEHPTVGTTFDLDARTRIHATRPFTLFDLLARNVVANPEAVAVVTADDEVTYHELGKRVAEMAGRLAGLGLARGDRICLHLPKSIDEVVATFAIARMGCAVTNIGVQRTVRQLTHVLRNSGARALVTTGQKARALVAEGTPTTLEHIVVHAVPEGAPESVVAWDDLTGGSVDPAPVIDRDLCAIMYTSGSTGLPKGVMLSHEMVVQSARSAAAHLQNRPDDRILGSLPLSFDFGLSQLTTMALVGGTLVMPRATLPVELVASVRRHRVNGIAMVPTMWIPVVRMLVAEGATLDDVRYVAVSGGPLPTDVLRAWPEVFPNARHYIMYGMTEGFRSSYLAPEDFPRKIPSVGKPLPNVELFIVDPEKGLCGPNEPGELIHRSSLMSEGYLGDRETTDATFKPNPHLAHLIGDEPVLHSGDTFYRDEDGYLYFVARTKTFIKCSDYRISPTEVEDIVFSSGRVTDVVAFGVPDEELGQVVHIAVTPADDGPLELAELRRYCRKNMPVYMTPRAIHEWSGAMPLTANGKPDRPAVIRALTES